MIKMTKYWFKPRKRFGYGWTPVSWEGIMMTIVLLVLIILAVAFFDLQHATAKQGFRFLATLIILLVIFSYIANKKTKEPLLFKRRK